MSGVASGSRATGLAAALLAGVLAAGAGPANAQEVIVFSGIDDVIGWLQSENFWGEEARGEQLDVPYVIMTGINPQWRTTAQELPVSHKKEVFYRFMLPLVLHANRMVRAGRARIESIRQNRGPVTADEIAALRDAAALFRVETSDASFEPGTHAYDALLDELLYKLDVIPAGLVLGQAAYESGYGASRFAVEGNALFGQWTYGGQGLVPEQQRQHLGDHRIAAYDWPFDSVRGYYINLMSHPAYEEFRALRAAARAEGRPLDSLELADGLVRYSERGQEYVDTLKGMIRVNRLDIADNAVLRDEPVRFAIVTEDDDRAAELRSQIDDMRASGELQRIVDRMRLE